MEVTLIDKQKYLGELTKLLSGMATADRDAVLADISARFDTELSEGEVIRSLGSPTFAAVSVLRHYIPPEEREEQQAPAPEPEVVPEAALKSEPETEAVSEPEVEAEADSETRNAAPEQEAAEDGLIEPEPMPEALEEAAPIDDIVPEPEIEPVIEAKPEPEHEPEIAPETALDSETETETEAVSAPEAVNAAPEQEAAVDGLIEPEPMPETLDEAIEQTETVPEEAPESSSDEIDFPDIEVLLEGVDADELGTAAEAEPVADPVLQVEAEPVPEWLGHPILEADKPIQVKPDLRKRGKAKVGLLILYILGAIIIGVPVTLLLVILTICLLIVGVGLAFTGGFVFSFCFLGMTVVSDILLCAGAGMVLIGLALPVLYLTLLFFIRCVIGFVNLVIRKGGEWCYEQEEVDG